MPTDSAISKTLIAGAGIAVIAGALLVLDAGWLAGGDESTADVGEERRDTQTDETGSWPTPGSEDRTRVSRPLLQLVGVTVTDTTASAIIREKGGEALTYRVGDEVGGNRELVEIQSTYVILRDEQRRLQRLRIRDAGQQQGPDPEALREFAEGLLDDAGTDESTPPGEEDHRP